MRPFGIVQDSRRPHPLARPQSAACPLAHTNISDPLITIICQRNMLLVRAGRLRSSNFVDRRKQASENQNGLAQLAGSLAHLPHARMRTEASLGQATRADQQLRNKGVQKSCGLSIQGANPLDPCCCDDHAAVAVSIPSLFRQCLFALRWHPDSPCPLRDSGVGIRKVGR